MPNALASLFATSDEQLMWRVKLESDPHAFATLMSRWEKPIQRLCLRMTGDSHRAEDLAQTAFTRVFAHRADWQPTAKFSTFLWRVALNLCHDELRRTNRRAECSLDELSERGPSLQLLPSDESAPDAQADVHERGEHVRDALLKLPAQYREVVVLRHYEQLKFHEIAEVLGIPQGTVKSRMAEALTQLSRLLNHLNEVSLCKTNHRTAQLQAL